MINKQNLWFITLFSLILILGIYYVSMPKDALTVFSGKRQSKSPNFYICARIFRLLCGYFYSIKNRVKASVLNEQTNCIRLVSLVSATVSLERERVLLEYKIIGTAFNNIEYSRAHFSTQRKKDNS